MKKLLMLAALMLAACASWTKSTPEIAPVILPELPASLSYCPVLHGVSERIGERNDLTLGEVRELWAQDRVVAAQCIRRHTGLVDAWNKNRAEMMKVTTGREP